ncbi:PAS domain-containing protein [Citromicrobium bathyomarinum]|uniref:PAS domain-containing protein n=1 Tax=Citromicrobium bathyomarinum TaxID=72174 RepID=UPI00315AB63B
MPYPGRKRRFGVHLDGRSANPENILVGSRFRGPRPAQSSRCAPLDDAIDYYHPDDRARVRETFDSAVASGSPFHLDARIIDEQGVERPIMSRGICNFGPDGKPVELFGVLFDAPDTRPFTTFGNEDLNTLSLEEDYHADA